MYFVENAQQACEEVLLHSKETSINEIHIMLHLQPCMLKLEKLSKHHWIGTTKRTA